jgi:hypothetical protein
MILAISLGTQAVALISYFLALFFRGANTNEMLDSYEYYSFGLIVLAFSSTLSTLPHPNRYRWKDISLNRTFISVALWLFTLSVIGYVWRIRPIWSDEDFQAIRAWFEFPLKGSSLIHQPPLMHAIAFVSLKFFGFTEFGVRFPSICAFSLTTLIVYKSLLKVGVGQIFSLAIAILVLATEETVFRGVDARPYALGYFTSLIFFYFYLDAIQSERLKLVQQINVFSTALVCLMSLGFQPMVFVLSIFFLTIIFFEKERRVGIIIPILLALFFYLPIQFYIGTHSQDWATTYSFTDFSVSGFRKILDLHSQGLRSLLNNFAFLIAAIVVFSRFSVIQNSPKFKIVVFLPIFYVFFLIVVYVSWIDYPLGKKYFFFSYYLILISIGLCIGSLKAKSVVKPIFIILFLGYVTLLFPNRLFLRERNNEWVRDYRAALLDIRSKSPSKSLFVHLCPNLGCPSRLVGGTVYLSHVYPIFEDRYDATIKWTRELGNFKFYDEVYLIIVTDLEQPNEIKRILGPLAEVKIYDRILVARFDTSRLDIDNYFYQRIKRLYELHEKNLQVPQSFSFLYPLVILSKLNGEEKEYKYYNEYMRKVPRFSPEEFARLLGSYNKMQD